MSNSREEQRESLKGIRKEIDKAKDLMGKSKIADNQKNRDRIKGIFK